MDSDSDRFLLCNILCITKKLTAMFVPIFPKKRNPDTGGASLQEKLPGTKRLPKELAKWALTVSNAALADDIQQWVGDCKVLEQYLKPHNCVA